MRLTLTSLVAAIAILGLAAADCGDSPAAGQAQRSPDSALSDNSQMPVTSGNPTATPAQPGSATTPAPGERSARLPLSDRVDGYIALAPAVLRAGQMESVSVSLFDGQDPAKGEVRVELLHRGSSLAHTQANIDGSSMVDLQVPDVSPGDYELKVSGQGFAERAWVRIERRNPVLLLETDKPIYKPGQDILIRVLQLGPELKPLPGEVTVEIQDAKGNKIFRKASMSDDFGMTNFTMPLSTEPNLGTWKITAASGEQTTQIDVTVDKYSLPKYEIVVDVPKNWVLANEPVIGTVSAEYSFGKPVKGEVEIVASRYVGEWEEFATFTADIDGSSSFELPAVDYVAGVPAAGGQGNLALDVTVREKSTGYAEHTSRLLTVAAAPVNLRIIPESYTFKPQLPFSFLLVTETPDNQPLDRTVRVDLDFTGKDLESIEGYSIQTKTERGKRLLRITPPKDAVALSLTARAGRSRIGFFASEAFESVAIKASYSPSNSFIHVEQSDVGPLEVGGQARFKVYSTNAAGNVYYEVMARGRVVFSGVSRARDIAFGLTPIMAPSSRLVVYQILPNSEVAADYIPFDVAARYPMEIDVGFSSSEARPGEAVDINVTTQGPSKVGLAAVDRSVFILAENRLNLQQVFAELERLYMQPRVELHDAWVFDRAWTEGAEETFEKAGLVVMSSMEIPQGKEYEKPPEPQPEMMREVVIKEVPVEKMVTAAPMAVAAPAAAPAAPQETEGLAEVQRVRQFFPETWLWANVMTDDDGRATLPAEAPDSITTWMLRGVALSKEHGLGVAEAELRVFQPFFLQVDLPYSAIRGEEFPVKVALYNYLDEPQEFFVELEKSESFELLDAATKTIMVDPSDVGGLAFNIRLTELGSVPLKVTARSRESADAVIKDLLVEPEGVRHETVENRIVAAGEPFTFDNATPSGSIPGSARTYVTLTGSYLSQTIEGLEGLLQMPFGCGEQNMILFAPNVFVARYLEENRSNKTRGACEGGAPDGDRLSA